LRFVDCAESAYAARLYTLESGYFAVGALCGGTDVRKGTISERTVSAGVELLGIFGCMLNSVRVRKPPPLLLRWWLFLNNPQQECRETILKPKLLHSCTPPRIMVCIQAK
jgi:hypothetical protein